MISYTDSSISPTPVVGGSISGNVSRGIGTTESSSIVKGNFIKNIGSCLLINPYDNVVKDKKKKKKNRRMSQI
jgi:hypothetical protein